MRSAQGALQCRLVSISFPFFHIWAGSSAQHAQRCCVPPLSSFAPRAGFVRSRQRFVRGDQWQDRQASAEGVDWAEVVSGGSEEVVGFKRSVPIILCGNRKVQVLSIFQK